MLNFILNFDTKLIVESVLILKTYFFSEIKFGMFLLYF